MNLFGQDKEKLHLFVHSCIYARFASNIIMWQEAKDKAASSFIN